MNLIAVALANFEDIVTNFIYVDKTQYLYNLINCGDKYYFLSRPRRFGKSLTLSTLKAIFEAKKELFNTLFIGSTTWKWEKHPIIHLDFNAISHGNVNEMEENILNVLQFIALEHEIIVSSKKSSMYLSELIKKLVNKYKKRVVFLVDEYDKPIISHLGEGLEALNIAKQNRKFMKDFYEKLKPLEEYLQLVFITGVSKFSKVSIFSTLNNLIELDVTEEYSTMLGYTEEELKKYFNEYFENYAIKENISLEKAYDLFKKHYNGFRFSEAQTYVYNPFSVGRALKYLKIDNYWFQSGSPSFLVNLIKENKYDFNNFENSLITDSQIKAYDIENLNITALLYQTGYLTIGFYEHILGEKKIKLKFPNYEVKHGFYTELLSCYEDKKNNISQTNLINQIQENLLAKNFPKIIELFQVIYSTIPYTLKAKKSVADYEQNYHNIFFLVINLIATYNIIINTEIINANGRIDAVIILDDDIYIIEFKCNQTPLKALNQIKKQKYYEPYLASCKNIYLVGINFNTKKHNIDHYKIVEYK